MINPDIQLRLELDPRFDYIRLYAKSPFIESFMKSQISEEDPYYYKEDDKFYNLRESHFYSQFRYYLKTLDYLTRFIDDDESVINLSVLRQVGLSDGITQIYYHAYTDKELQQFTTKTQNILDKITQSIMFTKTQRKAEFKIKLEYKE